MTDLWLAAGFVLLIALLTAVALLATARAQRRP